jgi:ubiquinone/menaquinone biosynthesis C-methylase UbiE
VKSVVIDVGCGKNKRPGSVGLDIARVEGVDVLGDVTFGLPFKNDSVDGVHMSHLLEHMDDLVAVMNEVWRVCKPGARVYITVPHASSSFVTWRDPTHKRGINLSTFSYFNPSKIEGQIFAYYSRAAFRPVYSKLRFQPLFDPLFPRNRVSQVVMDILEAIANRSEYSQYVCERWWGHWFGIAEAYTILEAVK